MALQSSIDDPNTRARRRGILRLVGVVNIPIIHFSVEWWNTLHQPAAVGWSARHPSMRSILVPAAHNGRAAFKAYFFTGSGACAIPFSNVRNIRFWVTETVGAKQ